MRLFIKKISNFAYKKHFMIDVNFQEKYCQQQKKAAIAQKAYANVSSILYHLSGVNNGIYNAISVAITRLVN